MDNEIKNIEEFENEEKEVNESGKSGMSGLTKFLIGAGIVGVGAAIIYKTRNFREKRTIEKLRKKGYVIQEPVALEESTDVIDAEAVETEE